MTAPIRIVDAVLQPFLGGATRDFEEGSVTEIVTGTDEGCAWILEALLGLRPLQGGRIVLLGEDTGDLPARKLYELRSRVGVFHRGGGLISNLKAVENVALPLLYHSPRSTDEVAEAAFRSLELAGYEGSPFELPGRLSPPRRAAVGLARVLAMDSGAVLYDRLGSDLQEEERGDLLRRAFAFHREKPGRVSIFLFAHPGAISVGEPKTVLQLSKGRFE